MKEIFLLLDDLEKLTIKQEKALAVEEMDTYFSLEKKRAKIRDYISSWKGINQTGTADRVKIKERFKQLLKLEQANKKLVQGRIKILRKQENELHQQKRVTSAYYPAMGKKKLPYLDRQL
ncbi:MAG: hypothetical protein PHN32_06240 [Actinomycetota bacterium]|jgi:Spy/CpxP family protein refolding chaperone|nr:hypothetical protein [Actinomycetota bacterium]